MKNKQAVAGTVGVVTGFILGFFVSQFVAQNRLVNSAPPQGQARGQQGELPSDHPSTQLMEMMQRLLAQAQANPQDHEVRLVLGNAFYEMRRFPDAIRWYEEADSMAPGNINLLTDLGTSYFYSGQPQKALGLFAKSLAIDPTHPQTLHNLGVVHQSIHQHDQAIRAWEKLLDTHPDYPQATEIRDQIEKIRDDAKPGES
ncbi:MAG: tetratricopeptide repeat protein [Acidobacteriota bacterium]